MTTQEIKTRFLLLYDKVASLDAPGYVDSEISEFLNIAQESEFLEVIEGIRKKSFDSNERRKKDLSNIIRTSELSLSSDQDDILPNGFLFDLPDDLAFTITESLTLASENECLDGSTVNVLPYTYDEYSANINNPFKKPENSAWRLEYNTNRHELILPPNTTPDKYVIRYLKKPVNIDIENDITSELSDYFIHNIINRAVTLATSVTNPELYQVKLSEEIKTNK
jgi:hypothetical protein